MLAASSSSHTAATHQVHAVFKQDRFYGYTVMLSMKQPNGIRVRFEALMQPTLLSQPVRVVLPYPTAVLT